MAKNMAIIENGVITNFLWCSDSVKETDVQVDTGDRLVELGDIYKDGKFYRNGVEVLTQLEEALKRNAEYRATLDEYEMALAEIEQALGV